MIRTSVEKKLIWRSFSPLWKDERKKKRLSIFLHLRLFLVKSYLIKIIIDDITEGIVKLRFLFIILAVFGCYIIAPRAPRI